MHNLPEMYKKLSTICVIAACVMIAGCSSKDGNSSQKFPSNFKTMSDKERMDYVMRTADPDSVARFLCNAAVGKVDGARIDSLNMAYLYVMERYSGGDLDKFAVEFQNAKDQLPLAEKMQADFKLGLADSLQVGYDLGLGYVNQIRSKNLDVATAKQEISDFKKACGRDTATYNRFIRGFKTALRSDYGKDLKKEIYNTFINY